MVGSAEVFWWCSAVLGALPLLLLLLRRWNDLTFFVSHKLRAANGNAGGGDLPPGVMGLPFLGEMLTFLWYFKILRRPDGFVDSIKKRYGEGAGLYRSHLFGKPTILVCSPAAAKFVLQSGDDFELKWPGNAMLVGKSSMLNVHGAHHARVRNCVEGVINRPASLRRIAEVVQPRMVSALRSWAVEGTVTAYREIKKVTFENISKIFVSMDPGPLAESLAKYFDGLVPGVRAFPFDFPGTAFHHALKCRKKLDAVFRMELENRKQRSKSEGTEGMDLMDGLMEMKDTEGKRLTDDEVVDNIVSLVVAGFESTSLASMWALYYLSRSPEILQRVREENEAMRELRDGEFITLDDVSKLKYTAKVVEETIRMTNIAYIIFRQAKNEVEYKGYRIPKGWQILIWTRTLHTDPKNFDDPLSFNPDRWNVPTKPGAYQAFGGGARICAGNRLARLQVTIILHHLALGYKWELVNPDGNIKYLPHPCPVDGAEMKFCTV